VLKKDDRSLNPDVAEVGGGKQEVTDHKIKQVGSELRFKPAYHRLRKVFLQSVRKGGKQEIPQKIQRETPRTFASFAPRQPYLFGGVARGDLVGLVVIQWVKTNLLKR
jgi:hypothetical protein